MCGGLEVIIFYLNFCSLGFPIDKGCHVINFLLSKKCLLLFFLLLLHFFLDYYIFCLILSSERMK